MAFYLNSYGRIVCLSLPAFLFVFAACAPRFDMRDQPSGTSVQTVSDMNLTSSADEFENFVEAWPSICDVVDGTPVCILPYTGRSNEAEGPGPIRKALVLLPGAYVCSFDAVQSGGGSGWLVSRQQYENDVFRLSGPPNPLRMANELDAAAFVRLCRTLRRQ